MSNDNCLINAIKSHNPFDRPLVVRSQDIWETGFPDVPSLNAHASDTVFDAIERVRTKQQPVIGITIKAERGLGKSHLISRIRRRLQTDGSALFVYTSEINDLNRIKAEFLRNLANSLKHIGSQGMSQWRELATAIFNEAYNKAFTPDEMVRHFSEVLKVNSKVVEHWTDRVLGIKHDIENPDIIAAILWTLSSNPSEERYAINWLAGQELPQSKADALGLANSSVQDREAQAFSTVRQILDLISDYKPIVICFDELESILMCNDAGFTASQVTAILAKDLYDKIKRGVFITAMFPQTWTDQIRALKEAESVTDRIAQKTIELTYLKSEDVIALVSQWLKDFYDQQEVIPPHSVYPFDEAKLRELGKEKPMVRKVLQWCAENWTLPIIITPPLPLKHPVESAYKNEIIALESKIKDEIEDNNKLANALRFSFSTLVGQILENVQITEIADIKARSIDQGYINFKIVGQEKGNIVKIGIAVLEGVSGMFLQAGLKRLIDYKKFDLTRGCLVRSKNVSSGTKAKQYLDNLLSHNLSGEWVLLKVEDIKPLLAMNSVMKARNDYELTETQIIDFALENRIIIDNNIIREILSDPSGQIPEDTIDEDI
ncbi:P-loop NTPase fold protein [uncultured Nostoc sp.]|uniref:P-loop NTPase fold protein n=1 Tax=uncultured Nostoc sp. TaxID=340711 RepID=UPI0035CAD363